MSFNVNVSAKYTLKAELGNILDAGCISYVTDTRRINVKYYLRMKV